MTVALDASRVTAPPAVVLCQNITGLATTRALAAAGVDVHRFLLDAESRARFSHIGTKIPLYGVHHDQPLLLRFLADYCQKLGTRPVVFPSGDGMALFLAKHAEMLRAHCIFPSTSYKDLYGLVSKDGLYAHAEAAGVPLVPHLVANDIESVAAWSQMHAGPYLIKPYYDSSEVQRPFGKNLQLADRASLLDYFARHQLCAVIVQQLIEGGDGYIFDCYGYCDKVGRILSMATHRRWRQYPPHLGTTCFGEIPANFGSDADQQIFAQTEKLVSQFRYHGIFGIEWLLDRATGQFRVIDFNARPFLTIGHLHACGLNLPALAYQELTGRLPATVERIPTLRHRYWIAMERDLISLHETEPNPLIAVRQWLRATSLSSSFAYQSWTDPGPGITEFFALAGRMVRYFGKKLLPRH